MIESSSNGNENANYIIVTPGIIYTRYRLHVSKESEMDKSKNSSQNKNCLFSIGEVSKICGVSVQTLRFYSSIDLIAPAWIDSSTGYRYYTQNHLQLIDRVKYLQKFGFSLEEIKTIFQNSQFNLDYLCNSMENKLATLEKELSSMQYKINEIKWYYNLFSLAADSYQDVLFRQHFEERYVLYIPIANDETDSQAYRRMLKMKNSGLYKSLNWRFQFCYSVDINKILDHQFIPKWVGVFLSEPPDSYQNNILCLPSGDYFCYEAKLRTSSWNVQPLKTFLNNKTLPPQSFAIEIENSVIDFNNSMFIIQFPVKAI